MGAEPERRDAGTTGRRFDGPDQLRRVARRPAASETSNVSDVPNQVTRLTALGANPYGVGATVPLAG